MRLAALYDIHANLPALEDMCQAQVDCIVVGGDIVPRPMPRETLTCLLSLDIPVQFIRGNCEREMLEQVAGVATGSVSARYREAVGWVAQQLLPDYERLLAGWPLTLQVEIPGLGAVLFCHATPRDDDEIFTRLTPEDRLLPIFERLDVPLVVCGHTHMQFDRAIGRIRVVNAGSVGMPFGEPGACWLLLGPDVQFRYTRYDLTKAAERIRQTNYPLAQILHPVTSRNPPQRKKCWTYLLSMN